MKYLKTFIISLALSLLVLGVTACKEKAPAEKAGEKVDETMEKAGEKVNELLGK